MGVKRFFRKLFKRDDFCPVDEYGLPKFEIKVPMPSKIETEEQLKQKRSQLEKEIADIDKKLMIFNNRRNCQQTAAQDEGFKDIGMIPVIINGTFRYIGDSSKPTTKSNEEEQRRVNFKKEMKKANAVKLNLGEVTVYETEPAVVELDEEE